MLELEIILDFTCCLCHSGMGVTLKCAGQGINGGGMATVKVPCPTCGDFNQLYFTPEDGTLREVRPARLRRLIAEPSCN